MNESPLVSRKRAADISATRVLPLVLLSMPILSACGGGGSSTVSDASQTDQQAQNDEEQDQVSDISGDETEVVVTNAAPTIFIVDRLRSQNRESFHKNSSNLNLHVKRYINKRIRDY